MMLVIFMKDVHGFVKTESMALLIRWAILLFLRNMTKWQILKKNGLGLQFEMKMKFCDVDI